MPMEDDINSQESDIFERESNESKTAEEPKYVGVITNLTDIAQFSTGKRKAYIDGMAVDNKDNEDKVEVVDNNIDMLQSPKVTCMATTCSGFLKEMSNDQKILVARMVNKWTTTHGEEVVLTSLTALAACTGIIITRLVSAPCHRGKQDKSMAKTPSAKDGATKGILKGLRFALSGTWPELGGSQGLNLGKNRVKGHIEKFGGSVTS